MGVSEILVFFAITLFNIQGGVMIMRGTGPVFESHQQCDMAINHLGRSLLGKEGIIGFVKTCSSVIDEVWLAKFQSPSKNI